ncbi:hypothetical protein F5Y09DRAFT_326375, partial [Xylaria sp. FL1042]
MRLLKVSPLALHEFSESDVPTYAILSHTWGEEEILLEDIRHIEQAKTKRGFEKVHRACQLAKSQGYKYIWIDTCCTIQTHHRRQCPTKRAASAAENGGSWYPAFI